MVQWGNDKEKEISDMKRHYFNSKAEAERFIRENHITDYHFESSEIYESGVDLVIDDFVCEICGERTPLRCEGEYPNTCEDCMPHTVILTTARNFYD